MTHLSYTVDDHLATLVLHNAPQNRVDKQMTDELADALDAIGRSGSRAVLLRAEGPDFSFGGDILPWPEMKVQELRALFDYHMNVFNQFERLPMPVLAAVQGLCFGGGFELALRADVIFAGQSARFGHPEQTSGIVTLLGGVYRTAERAGRTRAAEWALTSEQVPAKVMAEAGVVNRVVADVDLLREAEAFARKISKGPTRAYAAHKALLRAWSVGGVAAADETIFDIALPLFDTEDAKTGLRSAVNALKAGKPRPVLEFQGR
jgi:enoyl-CoA hydratase/carnithine racemase